MILLQNIPMAVKCINSVDGEKLKSGYVMESNKINASDISTMFPDVPINIIEKDLEVTFSGEITINRILDGQVSYSV